MGKTKNAYQKDIKEAFLLYWSKIEIEVDILDPEGVKRHMILAKRRT